VTVRAAEAYLWGFTGRGVVGQTPRLSEEARKGDR